jgi:hypothetical protein
MISHRKNVEKKKKKRKRQDIHKGNKAYEMPTYQQSLQIQASLRRARDLTNVNWKDGVDL